MADGGEKSENKRNLCDLSKSFSDITRTPKKQREECMFERIWFSSTPHHECTNYAPSGNSWRYQTNSYGRKLFIQEEIADHLNQEVATAIQPLQARITKLEEFTCNWTSWSNTVEDLSFESPAPPISSWISRATFITLSSSINYNRSYKRKILAYKNADFTKLNHLIEICDWTKSINESKLNL